MKAMTVAAQSVWQAIGARHLTLRDAVTMLPYMVAAFVLATFPLHGASNDELVQHTYGEMLWRYYESGFVDDALFEYKNLFLYGGMFDFLAVGVGKILPFLDIWQLRHLLSGLIGVIGMVGAARLARQLMGERAALISIVLLILTGMWSGAMFTHTKDVPFAAAMVWSLYYIVRVAESLPRPSAMTLLKLGGAIGFAIGLRVGAVLTIGYLGLAVLAMTMVRESGWRPRALFLARCCGVLLPAAALALAMMAFFWPWSVQSPDNVLKALGAFSRFVFNMYTIVDGEVVPLRDVPRTYLLEYLAVKLPELTLVGLALAALSGAVWLRRGGVMTQAGRVRLALWAPVLFAGLFPVVYAVISKPPMYNGLRHFLFVVPPLTVMAAAGIVAALDWARRRHRRAFAVRGAFVALVLLAAGPLVVLHPYGYVSFNSLTGWLPGASSRWETDYWSSSLREASLELERYIGQVRFKPGHIYSVAVCAEGFQVNDLLGPHFEVTPNWPSADFFLSSTQMGCDSALDGQIVATVERMGVPLAVVKDRRPALANRR